MSIALGEAIGSPSLGTGTTRQNVWGRLKTWATWQRLLMLTRYSWVAQSPHPDQKTNWDHLSYRRPIKACDSWPASCPLMRLWPDPWGWKACVPLRLPSVTNFGVLRSFKPWLLWISCSLLALEPFRELIKDTQLESCLWHLGKDEKKKKTF